MGGGTSECFILRKTLSRSNMSYHCKVHLLVVLSHLPNELLYILRCLYDNLCGGRCEQWQNNGKQWVLVESWIREAARLDSVQKGLRGESWPGCNRTARVPPVRGY